MATLFFPPSQFADIMAHNWWALATVTFGAFRPISGQYRLFSGRQVTDYGDDWLSEGVNSQLSAADNDS